MIAAPEFWIGRLDMSLRELLVKMSVRKCDHCVIPMPSPKGTINIHIEIFFSEEKSLRHTEMVSKLLEEK